MPSAAVLHDEDFINKSLLASLDAQADAEPLDDSDHHDDHDGPYHRHRPDSPDPAAFHHIHHARPSLYDYSSEYEQPKYKLNGFPNTNYRATFTSYPNATRSRHQANQSALANNPGPQYRDPASFYPSSDAFSAQITSPVPSHMQPYDPRQSFDYNSQPNGAHKSYLVDQFPLHNPAKPATQQQQQPYPSAQYSNGVQLSSQTPYGPHVPTMGGASNPVVPPGLTSSVSMNMPNGTNTTTSSGEEISTIFVVGFPEDMQEREFQNMFTFSSGFEAATLKIPNKEYTAYGSLVGGPPGSSLPNGVGVNALRGAGFQYAGPNDPYNLVTVNQGGVVVDGGRDGTMASWPAPAPNADDLNSGHYLGTGPGGATGLGLGMGLAGAGVGSNLNLPPRKQIIGFAKFRSREEALAARDILQGRRVDIEKGAVLKAEMAKKNLHTKRGVGPVPGVGVAVGVGVGGGLQQQTQSQQHMTGLSVAGLDAFSVEPAFPSPANPTSTNTTATASNRDSMPGLSRLGWRDSSAGLQQPSSSQAQSQTQGPQTPADSIGLPPGLGPNTNGTEDETKRDSVLPLSLGGISLSSVSSAVAAAATTASAAPGSQRGARERADDDDQLRRRKESKDREREMTLMRLRASNAAAYDAFHGVQVPATTPNGSAIGSTGMSRQSSTASTTSGSVSASASASSLSGSGVWISSTAPTTAGTGAESAASPVFGDAEEQGQQQQQEQQEEGNGGEHDEQQPHQDEIVGPWDRINNATAVARPTASESERSASPAGYAQQQGQGYQYQPQYMHLHEQQQLQLQQQLQQQQQQQGYHGSSQSESSETGSVVGAAESGAGSANPIGYVGARLGFTTGSSSLSQSGFPRGLAGYMTLSSIQQPIGPASTNSSVTATVINTNTAGAPSSGSSAAGSVGTGSGGHTSPQLPSPASASGGSGSGASASGSGSGTSAGTNGAGGSVGVRGTVDQNPPINTLYVGNLPTSPPPIGYPSDYLEETLREVFSVRPGYRKLCFRHKANGPMCFVEFEDVQFAAKALVEMSGNTLRGVVKNGIRLSYSKNPLGVRTPTSAGSNAGGPTLQQQQQLMQTLSNHHHHQQYHHQQQQQQQQQQHQMPPPPSSASSSSNSTSQDAFQPRLADDFTLHHRGALPTAILRRDSVLSPTAPASLAQAQAQAQAQQQQVYLSSSGSSSSSAGGGGGGASFFSSPPPRFYTTSPGSGIAFGTASSTPLTGASSTFVPRSAAANGVGAMYGLNHNHNGHNGVAGGGAAGNGGGFGGGYGGAQQAAFSPFGVPPFSNESPFGQPTIPPHLQPLSIPGEQHQHQPHQGGLGDD